MNHSDLFYTKTRAIIPPHCASPMEVSHLKLNSQMKKVVPRKLSWFLSSDANSLTLGSLGITNSKQIDFSRRNKPERSYRGNKPISDIIETSTFSGFCPSESCGEFTPGIGSTLVSKDWDIKRTGIQDEFSNSIIDMKIKLHKNQQLQSKIMADIIFGTWNTRNRLI